MSPVATSDAAFLGGACPTQEYTIAYTGNYTTSADASGAETGAILASLLQTARLNGLDPFTWTPRRTQ